MLYVNLWKMYVCVMNIDLIRTPEVCISPLGVPNGRMRYNHGSISDIKPASYVHHSELWQGPYNMPGMYKSVLIMATFVPLQENRICLSINICTNGGLSMSTVM